MAYRRTAFAPDEWYHCYSRGVDKRVVFEIRRDYERFLEALYLSNSVEIIPRSSFQRLKHTDVLQLPREESLVAIGAYCLMPNHFHLLIKEITEGGISKFMHRLGTSYTMYFNVSRQRVGNLFVKPFRSKHITDDIYFKRVAQYIHFNPIELFEQKWKVGFVAHPDSLIEHLHGYEYSSLPDYLDVNRLTRRILNEEAIALIEAYPIQVEETLNDMTKYYSELEKG